jgi:hypothetical protein
VKTGGVPNEIEKDTYSTMERIRDGEAVFLDAEGEIILVRPVDPETGSVSITDLPDCVVSFYIAVNLFMRREMEKTWADFEVSPERPEVPFAAFTSGFGVLPNGERIYPLDTPYDLNERIG